MSSKFSTFSRRGPDNVTEELVEVLSSPKSYEFKALFQVVHAGLRARNVASGGEEMLRLRSYEKLQNLVMHGQVKKTGKQYKGVPKAIRILSEELKSLRENGPSFVPKPANAPAKVASVPAKAVSASTKVVSVPTKKVSVPAKKAAAAPRVRTVRAK